MAYIHAIAAWHLELALYTVLLFASTLPEDLLLTVMRGFGRRGFGKEAFQLSDSSGSCSCCFSPPCSDRSCSWL